MANTIGERICEYRQLRKMTQEEFASRLGVTPQAVSKWERGNGLPDVSLLVGVCTILGMSADTLIGLEKPVVENGNMAAETQIKNHLIAEPIVLEFGKELIPIVCDGLKTDLLNNIRIDLAYRKGYLLPILRLRDNTALEDREYQISVYGKVFMKDSLAMDEEYSYEKMLNAVAKICEAHYDEILNKQIVKTLIDNLKEKYPGVADGLVPEKISYLQVLRFLQEKVRKQEDIRDLIHILEEIEKMHTFADKNV